MRDFLGLKFPVGDLTSSQFAENLDVRKVSVSDDILAHVRLWTFADTYLVDHLQETCLHLLHRDLVDFQINAESVGEIIDLIEYVWDNTLVSDHGGFSGGPHEAFRLLVLKYALAHGDELIKFPEFADWLDIEDTQFSCDFRQGRIDC
jgi:hypothetical protein